MIDIYKIKIGDTITPKTGYDIAEFFGLDYIMKRLRRYTPDDYDDFIFDGASCVPDKIACFIAGINQKAFTYLCAMRHDVQYAYTEPGSHNKTERKLVDLQFKSRLMSKCGMNMWLASICYWAVRMGGAPSFYKDFVWGFASTRVNENNKEVVV